MLLHAHPVAQNGPAAERRGRVNGQHSHLIQRLGGRPSPAGARHRDEPIGQGRLARTGGARQADRVGHGGAVGQAGHGETGLASPLDQRDQPSQRDPVVVLGQGQQRRRIRRRAVHRLVTLAPSDVREPTRSS